MKLVTFVNGMASISWQVITPQLMGRSVRPHGILSAGEAPQGALGVAIWGLNAAAAEERK